MFPRTLEILSKVSEHPEIRGLLRGEVFMWRGEVFEGGRPLGGV